MRLGASVKIPGGPHGSGDLWDAMVCDLCWLFGKPLHEVLARNKSGIDSQPIPAETRPRSLLRGEPTG